MNCEKCGSSIAQGDDREYYSKTLCEDCYIDAISPTRTCDPWAVHSAKNLGNAGGGFVLTPIQTTILSVLGETGGIQPAELAKQLGISTADLERETASLRHMEKLRGELRDGKKFLTLW